MLLQEIWGVIMANVINTNVGSINAQKNLSRANNALSTTMQRLSSGLRINSAKDDAAGLAITERQTTQIRGMNQAMRNANDGISLAQTAESALVEVTTNLQRMRELAVQSSNGVYAASDRVSMQKEVQALQEEIGRTMQIANFNGVGLFFNTSDNNFVTTMGFHVGANGNVSANMSTDVNRINFNNLHEFSVAANGTRGSVNGVVLGAAGSASLFSAMVSAKIFGFDAATSGVFGGVVTASGVVDNGSVLSITTLTGAQMAINWIDAGLNVVNDVRATFGALQNRFESTIRNLQDSVEATEASRSRIRDADFAAETANLTKTQILQQASISMLAQANQAPQNVLSLLQ
jgi:flagellin